jgi:hypothetical protein
MKLIAATTLAVALGVAPSMAQTYIHATAVVPLEYKIVGNPIHKSDRLLLNTMLKHLTDHMRAGSPNPIQVPVPPSSDLAKLFTAIGQQYKYDVFLETPNKSFGESLARNRQTMVIGQTPNKLCRQIKPYSLDDMPASLANIKIGNDDAIVALANALVMQSGYQTPVR